MKKRAPKKTAASRAPQFNPDAVADVFTVTRPAPRAPLYTCNRGHVFSSLHPIDVAFTSSDGVTPFAFKTGPLCPSCVVATLDLLCSAKVASAEDANDSH